MKAKGAIKLTYRCPSLFTETMFIYIVDHEYIQIKPIHATPYFEVALSVLVSKVPLLKEGVGAINALGGQATNRDRVSDLYLETLRTLSRLIDRV